jgi:hypothetical protein
MVNFDALRVLNSVYAVMFTQRVTEVSHMVHNTMDSSQMEPAADIMTGVTYCSLFCAPCAMSRGAKLSFSQPMKDITRIFSLICGKLDGNVTQTWGNYMSERAYMDKEISHSRKR